jgi:PD-(D/E)XK nuclease superfamily
MLNVKFTITADIPVKSANIIDVLLSTHDEEKYHSRVLAWLVDPAGSHGLGRAALNEITALAFPDWFIDEIINVKAEFKLDSRNMPDIGVLGIRQLLLIENKTRFSSITDGQVERYLKVAREKLPEKEIRIIHLLPGLRKEFPHLAKLGHETALVFWADIAEIIGNLISSGAVPSDANQSISIYYDYLIRTHAIGARTVALTPGHPRFSPSRSGITADLGSSRVEYLRQAAIRSNENSNRLDCIHAFIGFLENLKLLRIEYKQGKGIQQHWNITGSIPRADGGVTCIVQLWANGRICYEYRRLPEILANEYREMTFNEPEKGWREVWIETLPLEATFKAIRTIAQKASVTELPVVP